MKFDVEKTPKKYKIVRFFMNFQIPDLVIFLRAAMKSRPGDSSSQWKIKLKKRQKSAEKRRFFT